jgi:hypothetical protein
MQKKHCKIMPMAAKMLLLLRQEHLTPLHPSKKTGGG